MTDFEKAAVKGFAFCFPGAFQKGCLFHFGQAISKKFKNLDFQEEYQNDIRIKTFFKTYFC